MKEIDKFKVEVIATLGIAHLPEHDQDVLLAKVELLANKRIATALPELLSDDIYAQIEAKQAAGEKDDAILEYAQSQIPHYDEMMKALILDIAEELSKDL